MSNYIVVSCPHCNDLIQIFKEDIKCAIFRHGIYKDSFKPVDPHASKEQCESIKDKVYGCCKPFKLVVNGGVTIAIKCDYI